MLDFIKEHWVVIVGAIISVIVLIRFLSTLTKQISLSKRIDRDGVKANATVSRVEFDPDVEGAGGTYITYVTYRDDTGTQRESPLSEFVARKHEVDERLRIRFLPGDYSMVKLVKDE